MTDKAMFLALVMVFTSVVSGAQPNPAGPTINTTPTAPASSETSSPVKGNQFKEIDALLPQLSAATADISALIAGGVQSFPFKDENILLTMKDYQQKIEKECNERFHVQDLAGQAIPVSAQRELESYHQCKAFVDKNPKSCDVLTQYSWKTPQPHAASQCRKLQVKMIVAQSGLSGAVDGPQKCLAWVTDTDPPGTVTAENGRKICASIFGPGETLAVCQKVSALNSERFGARELRECQGNVGMLRGDESSCASVGGKSAPDERDTQNCSSFVAYRKAVTAGNAKLCGGLATCRTMMGASCEEYAKKLQSAYCRDTSADKFRLAAPSLQARIDQMTLEAKTHPKPSKGEAYQRAFTERRARIEAIIAQLSSALGGVEPKSTPQFKSRHEKFSSLRASVEKAMKGFTGVGDSSQRAVKRKNPDQK